MNNQKVARQVAKRRRVNSSSAVQNPSLPCKKAQILDDTWLEALKHITWFQWSKMSLVSRQVNGVIQRNLSRLPAPVLECATLQWFIFWFHPHGSRFHTFSIQSMGRSLQLLFHPIVYFKEVTIIAIHQKLSDIISDSEDRYIRCHSFSLKTSGDTPGKHPNITALSSSLKWLERNVRSDSISFPEWVSYRVHETVTARAMLSNFIFGASQKCKVQELIFCFCKHQVEFLNNLVEDFLAFNDVQSSIPTVVINYYPSDERYRAHLGENLIDREVDSQGADSLYEIKSGDKRVRISFCRVYIYLNEEYKVSVKFYTIKKDEEKKDSLINFFFSGTRPSITALSSSLKWLERNVRSDSISFPEWVSYRVHETVRARAILSDFIFGASQKCKVQELIFAHCEHPVEFLTNLIEDFLSLSIVEGTIPTVVIDHYPAEVQSRAHLGENLIGLEVDSQGADVLYEIEDGEKRVRISFRYISWNGDCKANVKFYTI